MLFASLYGVSGASGDASKREETTRLLAAALLRKETLLQRWPSSMSTGNEKCRRRTDISSGDSPPRDAALQQTEQRETKAHTA